MKAILSPSLFLGGLVINFQKRLLLPLIISFIIFVSVVIVDVASPFFKIFGDYEADIRYAISTITILIFPIAPIIYGWIIKDEVGSIVVGVIPIVAVLFYGNFILGSTYHMSRILEVIAYAGSLAIIGGIEGYFASKKRIEHLLIAICLGILWILVFLSGID